MSFVHRDVTNNNIICISRDLMRNFDESNFISNGPNIITRVMVDICATGNKTLWTRSRCHGATILPKERVMPLFYDDGPNYFLPEKLDETLNIVNHSTVIHVWNDKTKYWTYKVGTHNAYQVLAERHCPLVYFDTDSF